MGRSLSLMVILLPRFHRLIALKLLSSPVRARRGADATSVVHDIGEGFQVVGQMLLRHLQTQVLVLDVLKTILQVVHYLVLFSSAFSILLLLGEATG